VFVLIIFILVLWMVFRDTLPPRKDFYNELWGPAHLLVNGKSPYDTSILDAELPAAWLPMSIGFFAPLGFLDEPAATHLWLVLSLTSAGGIVMIAQSGLRPVYLTFASALFTFLFPPTIYHLLLGQFSLITTLCTIAAAHMIVRKRRWAGAFLLALGLSKPHLMTIAVLGLCLWHFQHEGAKSMLGFLARTAIASFALSLPLFIAYPGWIPDAIASMTSNAPWAFPTLLKLFEFNFGAWGRVLWGITSIGVFVFAIFIWRRFDLVTATYWNLGLALLISPYLGSWDFVVLIPIIIVSFVRSNLPGRIFIIAVYLAGWYGMALVQALENSHNHFFWWVPVWFLLAMAFVAPWKHRSPERAFRGF
jgi:hypothetical protein